MIRKKTKVSLFGLMETNKMATGHGVSGIIRISRFNFGNDIKNA